ncbi:endoglucanase II [Fomitiporia mediterranea MF3/22]|uniref:endoglucanase II n=1 Tax=Fomitiporia mediterranea (strain MF3/22) TaxID=694068 RepID=UPI0004409233|nr:endoglucanase II [Fomitiporia mediterranea MF3/22]EJD03601.1 endoglucanase II [Fomitiporia mediterranea MF3/22]
MRSFAQLAVGAAALASQVSAHYTFPSLVVNGQVTPAWLNVRRTNNYNSQSPVTDVNSIDLRCYDSSEPGTATTVTVSAGQELGIVADQAVYHQSTTNIYMARAPGDVDGWAGDGNVWFKVYELPPVTNGGQSITFPSMGKSQFTFTLPKNLPSGQYLVRMENIAIHSASSYGGVQFYISCGQLNVENGGSGTPGPMVAFPGAYTGYEAGLLINIYYPIPTNYTQPRPPVWSG